MVRWVLEGPSFLVDPHDLCHLCHLEDQASRHVLCRPSAQDTLAFRSQGDRELQANPAAPVLLSRPETRVHPVYHLARVCLRPGGQPGLAPLLPLAAQPGPVLLECLVFLVPLELPAIRSVLVSRPQAGPLAQEALVDPKGPSGLVILANQPPCLLFLLGGQAYLANPYGLVRLGPQAVPVTPGHRAWRFLADPEAQGDPQGRAARSDPRRHQVPTLLSDPVLQAFPVFPAFPEVLVSLSLDNPGGQEDPASRGALAFHGQACRVDPEGQGDLELREDPRVQGLAGEGLSVPVLAEALSVLGTSPHLCRGCVASR